MEATKITVKLSEIKFDEGVYPREAGHDPETVQKYAREIKSKMRHGVLHLYCKDFIVGWLFDGKIHFPRNNRDLCEIVFETWLSYAREECAKEMSTNQSRFIYFIQAGEGTPIKIGISQSPEYRLKELQIGNPNPLHILATIPAKQDCLERELHSRFSNSRISGEWFTPSDEIMEIISNAKNN